MRKFFRFFVCVLFCVSLFSQNVFAASSNVLRVDVYPFLNTNRNRVVPFVSSFTKADGTSQFVSSKYTFTNDMHVTFYHAGTRPNTPESFIPDGMYEGTTAFRYNFEFSLPFSDAPSGNANVLFSSDISMQVSFGDLPEGLNLIFRDAPTFKRVSPASSSINTFQGTFVFLLLGNFNTISGNSFNIPINFDFTVTDTYYDNFHKFVEWPQMIFDSDLVNYSAGYFTINITRISGSNSTDGILGDINDTIKDQHQEEVDKAEETGSSVTDSSGQLTGTLSAWEIFTMPFQLVKDFAQAISSDGNTGFTFPSFSMMGYEIWPSYTFDLNTIKSNFPVLYNGVHLVSGTIVVSGFIHYCWRKWSILMGDDLPEGSGSGEGNS